MTRADAPDSATSLAARADLTLPMAIRVAATLRLADHLAERPRTTASLASVARCNASALVSLLGRLRDAGIVEARDAGWSLTEHGEALRSDHPSGLRDRLAIDGPLGRADLAAVELLDAVRRGEPAFDRRYGFSFWDDLAMDPDRQAAYDRMMAADVTRWAGLVVPAYPWPAKGHVVDIGGGDGALLEAILAANPGLSGAIIDQPATAQAANARFAAAGLDGRADAVAADFFAPLPVRGDIALLCAVLHDWPDPAAQRILWNAAHALNLGGRVLVIEKTGADGAAPSSVMDLTMLIYFGARERSVAEITALAGWAGLRRSAVHRAADLSVIEFAVLP
ncbi:MAG: methyltransferase [Dehalococcoidia bacterium]